MTFNRGDEGKVQLEHNIPSNPPEAAPGQVSTGPQRRARVLVADSYSFVVVLVAETLRRAGYRVSTASTVREALACLNDHSVDAAIIDRVLDVAALDVMDRLGALGMPFSVLTADRSGRGWGVHKAAPTLRKPATPEQIVDAVGRLLG